MRLQNGHNSELINIIEVFTHFKAKVYLTRIPKVLSLKIVNNEEPVSSKLTPLNVFK